MASMVGFSRQCKSYRLEEISKSHHRVTIEIKEKFKFLKESYHERNR